MPANISFINGQAEAATALTPAWWDVGSANVLPFVPNSEQMIEEAHLDWTVAKRPIFDHNGDRINGYSVTTREDTGKHLGIVGNRYQVVQNREAFNFLDSLLMDEILKYESAGALRGGRTIWALARIPSVDEVAEGDTLNRYVLWLNSHDGCGAIYAIPTSVRVVCSNTARLAIAGHVGIRHCGNIKDKLKRAHEILSQADERFTLFRDQGRLLASTTANATQTSEYLRTLFPEPEESGRGRTNWQRKLAEITKTQDNDRQNLPSIKGTWWSLYNAVSEAIDHGDIFRFRGGDDARNENRMLSVMTGNGADLKSRAFDLAVAMAG